MVALTAGLPAHLQSSVQRTPNSSVDAGNFGTDGLAKPPPAVGSGFGGAFDDLNSTPSLAYPLNVAEDPQQGHYITFYIREIKQGKLKGGKLAARAKGARAAKDLKLAQNDPLATSADVVAAEKLVAEAGRVGRQSIVLQNLPTSRTAAAISLYMPPSVQVSYEAKYADQKIGLIAETGYDLIKGFQTGTKARDQVMTALGGLGEIFRNAALATIEAAAPGGKALYAIERGKVITPKMELMFEGLGRRNFSFVFVFIPKSRAEAHEVNNIVSLFKKHMSTDFVGEGINTYREMSFPDQFDIEYMHIGKRNPYLNRIGRCALTKLDVEYGGDRYVAYDGGIPQTTKLTLNFTEFEIVTRTKIDEGY